MGEREREVTNAFIYIFPQGHTDSCKFSERVKEIEEKKSLMRSLGV